MYLKKSLRILTLTFIFSISLNSCTEKIDLKGFNSKAWIEDKKGCASKGPNLLRRFIRNATHFWVKNKQPLNNFWENQTARTWIKDGEKPFTTFMSHLSYAILQLRTQKLLQLNLNRLTEFGL